jgi:alkylation response protein AidB-like acyl-CoA dehydrogenase
MSQGFHQEPPRLANQFDDDPLLREVLARLVPPELYADIAPELRELGALAVTFAAEQARDRHNEPRLVQWDPWGWRIDAIEVTPLWRAAQRVAAERGLVALGYERRHGAHARVHQFAANYLLDASLDIYSCPLAMTDGAARTLLELRDAGNAELVDRAVARLTSRDPDQMWTSGQWMTERTGGSDVGLTETVARRSPEGWRLYGDKWFTSATTANMALTLARPEGNGPGGRGLALFYVELRDAAGRWNGIRVNRLKDKLGTRKVPTAELTLDGTLATPVAGLDSGVKNITPMLSITRVWNSVGAIGGMRRAIALARDYARKRVQFGARLAEKPLHRDTLAALQAELEGALVLVFRVVELLGRKETGVASADEGDLLRLLTPLCKLTTGKQAVAVASEALECFGGAGYVEDTGLPRLLRDAQVLPIWEGTTNVLSLDTLRAVARHGLRPLEAEVARLAEAVTEPALAPCADAARRALAHARDWLERCGGDATLVEAGARRFALTLGRAAELALLAAHAQQHPGRAAAAARQLLRNGVDRVVDADSTGDTELLA